MSTAYTISKDFSFSYSHRLTGLPDDHQCARLHGHNAIVRITLGADVLDGTGFIIDYGDLAPFGRWLDERFDHQHLNDRVPFNPTAESLARCAAEWVTENHPEWPLLSVSWSETPKSWATYTVPS